MSRLIFCDGTSRPTIVAAEEIFVRPRRPQARGTGFRNVSSLRHRTMRRMLIPQTFESSRKRSERNGMTISVDHPPSKSAVRVHQMPFQLLLGCSLVAT